MENARGTEDPAAVPVSSKSPTTGPKGGPTFGIKLSPHTHPHRISGTKLSTHTHPHRISGTKLSPLARNGSIWRFFCMQGEFCTVLTTKRPSRENFVPNARQISSEPTQQHPGATGVKGAGGTGGPGRGAKGWPRHPRVTARPPPDKFRMQFDWAKFQQTQKTLQFQRCKFNV